MTEHKQGQPEILIENNPPGQNSNNYLTAASIIVGSLIIAGSIFYTNKLLVEKFDKNLAAIQPAGAQAQVQAGQQQAAGAQAQNPGQPVKVSDRSGEAIIGNKNAQVAMYEFSDFQCPFCKKFFDETLSQIKTKYIDTGKVKLIFRNYPLPFHQNAQKAAEAGECANRQGKFEAYHDVLFKNSQGDGTGLAIADLKKYADQLGLNSGTLGFGKNKFNTCLDNGEAADAVKKDIADATAVGVSGTPSFVLNGNKIVGAQPFASFQQAIDEALKK